VYRYTDAAARRARTDVPGRTAAGAATADPVEGDGFHRDAPTLLAYSVLASYAFWLYAFGPALALLQAELGFSYTVLGSYSALWSAGAALVGVTFARLTPRLSRRTLLWGSAVTATGGAALFVAAQGVGFTMLGAALLGFAGTTLLTVTQAMLSDRHGPNRDRALVEANIGAGACAVLAPLLLGLLQATPAGWRAALVLPVLALAGLYLRYRHQPLSRPPEAHGSGGAARLPLACWLFAVLVAVGIAVEFCLVYFGAGLLATTGLDTTHAATAMSSLYLGILAGRVGGAFIIRRIGGTVALLWTSLALTTAGFLVFWLVDLSVLAIIGLFVCGLGIANLYPLSVALALAAAPGQGDTANARTQLLGGVLVTVAPYLLGGLADHVGLRAAFAIEVVLIGISALLLVAGLRARGRVAAQQR
jgi:MFS family permease